MKKLATVCLITFATLSIGCSANKANTSQTLDANTSGVIAQADQPYACRVMQGHRSGMFCSQ